MGNMNIKMFFLFFFKVLYKILNYPLMRYWSSGKKLQDNEGIKSNNVTYKTGSTLLPDYQPNSAMASIAHLHVI